MRPDLTLREVQIRIAAHQGRSGVMAFGLGNASRLIERRLMAMGPGG